MEKLYYGGKIYTLDRENRVYTAIGTDRGRIVFLGTNQEAEQIPAEERIALKGACMMPGFIDSHLHMLNYAFVEKSYKMFGADSIESIIEEGRRRIAEMAADSERWLYGRGWNEQDFRGEKRPLTRQDLDNISKDRPILLIRVCGHAAAVNTMALDMIRKLPETAGYMEQIDLEAGILTEASVKLCYNVMPKPSVEQIKDMIVSAQKKYNQCGITSVESDNFLSLPGRDRTSIMQAYEELETEGRLTVRVREQASFTCFEELKAFVDDGYRTGQGGEYYTIGPVKLYQDGSLGAKTALFHEPYAGTENCGQMIHTPEDLQRCVDYAYQHDMQILVHAIGDKAADMVCDAYEKTAEKYGKKGLRLAINHLQVISEDLPDRMKALDILAYIQPVFVAEDKTAVRPLLGSERERRSYIWKTLMDKGIHCCGSSDSPVESFSVLKGIQIAMTRQGLKERGEPWQPAQCLTAEEALRLFTIDNAYGAFAENEKGSLEIGKLADMVVLGSDIFETKPSEIHQIPIQKTIVGGQVVWKAEA